MNCSDVNAWLDMLMDNELSVEQRKELEAHAAVCPECAENIKATIEMKEMLDGMNDEADVPLAAQAAWRKAVKQEAIRIKAKKTYRRFAAVAASAVVLIGVTLAVNGGLVRPDNDAMLNNTVTAVQADIEECAVTSGIAVIESDGGTGEGAMARMMPAQTEAEALITCEMKVESVDDACGYISDLIAEYEGIIDIQKTDGEKANLYITIPSENLEAFLNASRHLDISGTAFDSVNNVAADSASLVIVLND